MQIRFKMKNSNLADSVHTIVQPIFYDLISLKFSFTKVFTFLIRFPL